MQILVLLSSVPVFLTMLDVFIYSKTCIKWPLKKNTKIVFQYQLSLNAWQKYCRMLHGEHSAILWTFIKLPFSIKTFVLSILKWPLKVFCTTFLPDINAGFQLTASIFNFG